MEVDVDRYCGGIVVVEEEVVVVEGGVERERKREGDHGMRIKCAKKENTKYEGVY